jgi:hypothetical protein
VVEFLPEHFRYLGCQVLIGPGEREALDTRACQFLGIRSVMGVKASANVLRRLSSVRAWSLSVSVRPRSERAWSLSAPRAAGSTSVR